jgi:lipopolysaccharide transport system permease protein
LFVNPMAGLIEGIRAAFLARSLDWPHIGISLLVAVAFFILGTAYFQQVENRFADVI